MPFYLYIAEARRHSGGAFPILTVEPSWRDSHHVGAKVSIVTRLQTIEPDPDLTVIPEEYKRVPHTFEDLVASAEKEADMKARQAALK